MAKYRSLNIEELESLEKEFIDYLIVNGIVADDWVEIKESNPEKAQHIIALFSDVVFEGIMRKVRFLERRSPKELQAFQCLPEKMILIGMRADQSSSVDFTDEIFMKQALKEPPQGLEVYSLEKKYQQQRELELFDMVQKGCHIAEGSTFKALALVMAS